MKVESITIRELKKRYHNQMKVILIHTLLLLIIVHKIDSEEWLDELIKEA